MKKQQLNACNEDVTLAIKAARLAEISSMRRELEKEEEILKHFFKSRIESGSIEIGGIKV
jgi:hypothetical protein